MSFAIQDAGWDSGLSAWPCLLHDFHSVASRLLSLDTVATVTGKEAKLWFFTKHTSFFISVSILSKCSRLRAEMQSKECTVWHKYLSLWCCPAPPICSWFYPLLEHYLLVDFMEHTRKPDKVSIFSAIARRRLEIAFIKLELFCPVQGVSTRPPNSNQLIEDFRVKKTQQGSLRLLQNRM